MIGALNHKRDVSHQHKVPSRFCAINSENIQEKDRSRSTASCSTSAELPG
jgi:hypothetical protein